MVSGEKVPLAKTVLLKYFNQASKNANGSHKSSGKVCHRDEFIHCNKCNKERRFRLRSKEECREHHDATLDVNWQCSDHPYDRITCDNDEERASRRMYRGCSRSPTCKGCTSCVCFGCEICRFSDCSCQTCRDFTSNARAQAWCIRSWFDRGFSTGSSSSCSSSIKRRLQLTCSFSRWLSWICPPAFCSIDVIDWLNHEKTKHLFLIDRFFMHPAGFW